MPPNESAAVDRPRTAAPSPSLDEPGLIERIGQGDMRAFDELYRLYHPRLTRFLLNLIRRPPLVEDVLNETLLVVWTHPGSFNGMSKVSTWIFAIAYRKAQRALRRQDEPVEDRRAQFRASADADPEWETGFRQVQEVLRDAINSLSPDHRAVIDLTYFHEVGYREIAEIMECPVDTVKSRMHYARRRLRNMLEGRLVDWL